MRHSAALCQRGTCFKAVKPIYVNIRLIFIQGFIVSKQEKEENMFIHLYFFFKNQRNVAGVWWTCCRGSIQTPSTKPLQILIELVM